MIEFECEFKPYCDDDCKNCNFAKEQKQMKELNEAVAELRESLMEIFAPVCEACIEAAEKMTDAFCRTYHNKRVVHLALHHPKEKVRKKNGHRIFKWIQQLGSKGVKRDD